MDWNGLKTFMKVVEAGSLSEAANRLGVNHSTVYRRLQNLETAVGAKLLELQGNRYALTSMGEELARFGADIDARFHDIDRLIVGKEFQPQGHVRITAPFNLANRFIPEALAEFRGAYPDISIEILSSNQELNMNSRIADIAVRATQAPPEYLVGRKVTSFPWGIYASQDYLAASPPLRSFEDIPRHHLIGGAGGMLNLPAFTWLEKHFPERIKTRCDELTAMSYMAERGHGIAFLPRDQKREGIERLMPLNNIPASEIWLLTHPDLRKVERIRLVMQCLADYFIDLPLD